MSKAKEFNKKFAEYKTKVQAGEVPNMLETTQLLLLANEIITESDDIGGEQGEINYEKMIDQLGVNRKGLLGDVDVVRAKADREVFLAKYQEALDEELKAKKNAASILAGTIVGLGTTALKLAL